jgi:hypothetical protein
VRLPFSLVAGTGTRKLTFPAESINLSKFGVCLRTETQLFPGQTVEVILLEGRPDPVVARVVWVGKPTGLNQFEFGLKYIESRSRPV